MAGSATARRLEQGTPLNSTESEIIERQAGRVVLLDADDAILLIEVVPASAAPFWLTPGGAIEPGETAREAAARELHEETGITVTPASLLGPVWRREHRFEWDGVVIHQQEEFYLARHDGTVEAALNNVDSVEAPRTAAFDGGPSRKPRQRAPNDSCLPRSLAISGCYSSKVCPTNPTMSERDAAVTPLVITRSVIGHHSGHERQRSHRRQAVRAAPALQ